MVGQDQLEIIAPNGQIVFFDLDPGKGVTNIGRHPDNDVVIDSPGVALFQAVLDHQQKPYRIMILSDEGDIRLGGQRLAPNVFQELQNWDSVEIDGHALILLEASGGAVSGEPARPAPAEARPSPAAPRLAVPPALPGGPPPRAKLPPDQSDDCIVVELSAREWVVDVEQTASFQVTVANGGSIVATFGIRVEGLDASWVTVAPAQVNLNEGARATVTVSITPPRLPSSAAGVHPLVVAVTSPNYPGHMSRTSGSLTINPYYAFAVGELAPRQQSVSWRKRSGEVTIPVTNKGNSETPFRLEGEDDEHACHFEFQVPGEDVRLLKQAEMRFRPDETYLVSVLVTPVRRRLIGLRSRSHSFTITTAMVEGAQTPRSVMGQLRSKPLIGPVLILLMILSLAVLVMFLLSPSAEPSLAIDNATPRHGDTVTLTYDASRFPKLKLMNLLNAAFLNLTLEYRTGDGTWQDIKTSSELEQPAGRAADMPPENGYYRLKAENWLTQLIPWIQAGKSQVVRVWLTPIKPEIVWFRANAPEGWVYQGQEVVVSWKVVDAESLTLDHDGVPEDLAGDELNSGQRSFQLGTDATFTLVATNPSWSEAAKAVVQIRVKAQPVPTPVIVRFDVDPLEITQGETVQIGWEVSGADTVSIDPLGEVPLKGEKVDGPTKATTYHLTAIKSDEYGNSAENAAWSAQVIVNTPPPPTAEPVAPVIQLFEATPKELVLGDPKTKDVQLTWSISGAFTQLQITNPDLVFSSVLSKTGTITVTPAETTLYVLTVFNGDLSSSLPAQVTVLEPTPTEEPTPTPEPPPPTETPFPPPIVSYFKAEALDPVADDVAFQNSYQGENGPVYVYLVEGGSRVKLSWGVKDAETVTLEGSGAQPPEGSLALPDAVVQDASYQLLAENNGGGNQVSAFIKFDVTSPPPPPEPPHVTGVEDAAAGTNRIVWSYRTEDRDSIDGFRIYRADVPPGSNFVAVWTEYNPNATEWTDAPGQTCGKAYYVVAVYTDLSTGEEQETAASATSWYSKPCP
jgi:hypothetical protein